MSVIAVPYTFSPGIARSAEVNANFSEIQTKFNATAVQTDVSKTITAVHTFAANVLFEDNLYDIGASGATRPRDLFLSRNLTVGGTAAITGAVTLSSTLAVAGRIYGADGTAADPAIRFNNSAAGLFYPGSDALGFGVGGSERMRIASGGQVLIGHTVTADSAAGDLVIAAGKYLRRTDSGLTTTRAMIGYSTAIGSLQIDPSASLPVTIGAVGTVSDAGAGDLVIANAKYLRALNAAGTNARPLIGRDVSNRLLLGLETQPLYLDNAVTSGSAGAIAGYFKINVAGTDRMVPYYVV